MMISVQTLFEVHLTVTDLDRAIAFYRDIVGLRLATVVSARQVAFFWCRSPAHARTPGGENGRWPYGRRL